MKKHNTTAKKNLNSLYGKLVTEFETGDLMPMDFCQVCNGYDTIQTYIQKENRTWIHVCEKCLKEILKQRGAS